MKRLQIYFGGCGGKWLYELGIAAGIQKYYGKELESYDVNYCGQSAGAVVALFMLFFNIEEMFDDKILKFLQDVDNQETKCVNVWYDYVVKHIVSILPPNAYKIASEKFSSQYFDIVKCRNVLKTSFSSNEDLVKAICAGGYITVFGKNLFYDYDDTKCYDGGLSDILFKTKPLRYDPNIHKTIEITHNMFTTLPTLWTWLLSDKTLCTEIYQTGLEDVEKHKEYFDNIFLQKRNFSLCSFT